MQLGIDLLVRGLVVALLILDFAGEAQEPFPRSTDFVRLIETQGVSGFESDVRAVITSLLPANVRSSTDEMGNLIVTVGQGKPHTLIAAHLDEPGYLVSQITDDGFLRLHRVTTGIRHRLFDQFHYGQPVVIRTKSGTQIPGVTATLSVHLHRSAGQEPDRIRGLDDLWVDVGAPSRDEVQKLGISLLDTVNLRDRGQALANGRIMGVSAQARGGAFALVELLRGLDQAANVSGTLTVAWTVQEAFGRKGLDRIAQEFKPDRVFIITDGFLPSAADVNERGAVGQLGAGPLIVESDNQLLQQARTKNISVQPMSKAHLPDAPYTGGPDWGKAEVSAVGLPVLFAESPVETVDQRDMAGLVRLLRAAIELPELQSEPPSSTDPQRREPNATMGGEAFDLLSRLINAYGVAGHEAPVRETIAKLLPRWAQPQVDERGNLTVSFGQGGKRLLFVAHMDEIGYEVERIKEDGTLALRKRGGFLDSLYEAHPALIHTRRGPVNAVLAPRAKYFTAEISTPKLEDLYVYLGTNSRPETESLGVAEGDSVTIPKRFVPLNGARGTGRSIDDRNGCTALLLALRHIDPSRVSNQVTFAWVVEEEIGLRGAAFLSQRHRPDYVFAVDTFVSSDSPLELPRFAHARIGTGAVVRAVDNSNIAPAESVTRVTELARRHDIPLTIGVTGGGNDGAVLSRYGAIDIPLSWPLRYSHSPVEVIDQRDLDALADLIFTLTQEF